MDSTPTPAQGHRLLTALMVERAGGAPVDPTAHPWVSPRDIRAARDLPWIGSLVDDETDTLVIDLEQAFRQDEPLHRRCLRDLLGDLPFRLRYGRHEDQDRS